MTKYSSKVSNQNDQSPPREGNNPQELETMGRIIRRIAHEIRNPLTNISLAAEQIRVICKENEEMKMLVEMIERNNRRIETMLKDLSAATKPPALSTEQLDLYQLLDEIIDETRSKYGDGKIEIQKEFDGHSCEVNGDEPKLKSAFAQIILNAVESLDEKGGLIKLAAGKDDENCLVQISDNGIGMDPATLDQSFEPFFSKKEKASGLGLTNALNIISAHHGRITIESNPGNGTSVLVSVPAC